MKYLNNGFSMNMVTKENFVTITKEISKDEFESIKHDYLSVISHEDLAEMIGVECNPQKIELQSGDEVLVAQLKDRKCLMDEMHILSMHDYKFVLVKVLDIDEIIIK